MHCLDNSPTLLEFVYRYQPVRHRLVPLWVPVWVTGKIQVCPLWLKRWY